MNDDELLEQLSAAFAVEPVQPPPESVTALHRAVRAGTRSQPQSSRRRRWVSAGLVGGALSTGWAAAAAAYDDPLPGPMRSIAYEVGLPVDSRNLVKARNDRDALRAALRRNDHAAIATQADELRRKLRSLDSGERSAIQPEADQLLQQANDDHSSQNDHQDAAANEGQSGASNNPTVSNAPGIDPNDNTQGSDNSPNANPSNNQSQSTDGGPPQGGSETTGAFDPANINDGSV